MRKKEGGLRAVALAGFMVAALTFMVLIVTLSAPLSRPAVLLAKKQQQLSNTQTPESWTGKAKNGQPVVVQHNSGNMKYHPSSAKRAQIRPTLTEQQPESWTGGDKGHPVVVHQSSGSTQHTPSGAKKTVRLPSLSKRQLATKLPSLDQQAQESYTIYDPNGAGTRVNQHNSGNFIPNYPPLHPSIRSPALSIYPQAPESWTIQDPSDSSRTRINQHNSGNFVPSLPAYPPQSARAEQEVGVLVPVGMPALNDQQPEGYMVYSPMGSE